MHDKYITWVCPECGARLEWDYSDLAERGEPVCLICNLDMEWEGPESD